METNIIYDKNFQNALAVKAKKGNIKARNLLLESIRGYIITIVNMKAPDRNLRDDLIQEVYLHLISDAIPRFDTTKGVPFRTYAVYWIMSSVNHYLNRNLLNFPFSIPDNIGYYYRSGFRKKAGLDNYRFISKVKNDKGNESDIFDSISDAPDEHIELNNELLNKYMESLLEHYKDSKTKDLLSRYLCLGKYKDYPELNIKKLADVYGITNQGLHKKIMNRFQRIRTDKLKRVLKGTV